MFAPYKFTSNNAIENTVNWVPDFGGLIQSINNIFSNKRTMSPDF